MIDVRHLSSNPTIAPIARYVQAFESSKGRRPAAVHVSSKEFGSILRLARKHCLDPMKKKCDRVSYQGIPVVGV